MNKMENVLQNKKVSGLQEVCLAGKTADRKRRKGIWELWLRCFLGR